MARQETQSLPCNTVEHLPAAHVAQHFLLDKAAVIALHAHRPLPLRAEHIDAVAPVTASVQQAARLTLGGLEPVADTLCQADPLAHVPQYARHQISLMEGLGHTLTLKVTGQHETGNPRGGRTPEPALLGFGHEGHGPVVRSE